MSDNNIVKLDHEYSKFQFWVLVLLRVVIGYHFIYEGFNKLVNPLWTSAGFLSQSYGVFSSIANSPFFLSAVNFINIWGQIFIGLSLIVGLFTRYASWAGVLLLLLYYIALPPSVLGNFFVDRNLLELFGLMIVALFPTSQVIGLDGLFSKLRSLKNG